MTLGLPGGWVWGGEKARGQLLSRQVSFWRPDVRQLKPKKLGRCNQNRQWEMTAQLRWSLVSVPPASKTRQPFIWGLKRETSNFSSHPIAQERG